MKTNDDNKKRDRRTKAALLVQLAATEAKLRAVEREALETAEREGRLRNRLEIARQHADEDRTTRLKADAARNVDMRKLLGHLAAAHGAVVDARFALGAEAANGSGAALAKARTELEEAALVPSLKPTFESLFGMPASVLLGGVAVLGMAYYMFSKNFPQQPAAGDAAAAPASAPEPAHAPF